MLFFSYGKDPSCLDTAELEEGLVNAVNTAVEAREAYHESATMAVSLTKPRGGKKKDRLFLSS